MFYPSHLLDSNMITAMTSLVSFISLPHSYRRYSRSIARVYCPMHYYSQREDKDLHLGLLQYILQANPKSQVLSDDASLFANNGGVTAAAAAAGGKGSQEGGWFSRITSWRGGPASSTPAATSATSRGCDDGSEGGPATSADAALIERTATALAAASITSRGSPPSTRGGGGQLKGGHVRRKTVRPVRASIHAHYN